MKYRGGFLYNCCEWIKGCFWGVLNVLKELINDMSVIVWYELIEFLILL